MLFILRGMDDSSSFKETGEILSVSAVNREARQLLEEGLGSCAVIGEISNLARPQSGHIYFSLKDEQAQLRCAFFRQRQRGLRFQPQNGDEVIVFGKVSLYEPRGDYQLIAEHMEAAGAGVLQQRFDALKRKLAAEGLFDEARKQELPVLPQRIGIITSPSGAAIRDILNILRRRFASVPVRIYPVAVQGTGAPAEIAAALAVADQRQDCDLLILARGGGSIEDLWAFNEEIVARAIAACSIPIISGVGHETDTTIADYVADLRAPTPSGAAELAVPDQQEWLAQALSFERRLNDTWQRHLSDRQQRLDWLSRALAAKSPAAELELRRERLQVAKLRLAGGLRATLYSRREKLVQFNQRLRGVSPLSRLNLAERRLENLGHRLRELCTASVQQTSRRLALAARALHAISPLATLSRGFAIVTEQASGTVVTDSGKITPGDPIAVRLKKGHLVATVSERHDASEDS